MEQENRRAPGRGLRAIFASLRVQIIVLLVLGSVQLFCLALMGEYVAKIFTEVRHRPRYIISKKL